jgi:hypothetical protein
VRADVQVVYRPDKPHDEFVSAADRVVVIEQTTASAITEHKPPRLRVVVTAASDVGRLREDVNKAATEPTVELFGCPPIFNGDEPPVYQLSFQRTAQSTPDLIATTQQYCEPSTGVTVHGQSRPLLTADSLPTLAGELVQPRH